MLKLLFVLAFVTSSFAIISRCPDESIDRNSVSNYKKSPKIRVMEITLSGETSGETICGPNSACLCCHDNATKEFSIHCSGKNLKELPVLIEPSVYRSNASTLHYLQVELISYVDLSMNAFESTPNMSRHGYELVKILNMSGNHIQSVTEDLISPNLQAVFLDNNDIEHIDGEVLKKIHTESVITNLTLHGNPWKCNCKSADLVDFLHRTTRKYPNISNITCSNTDIQIINLKREGLCSHQLYLIIVIIVFAVLLIALSGFALYWTCFIFMREKKSSDIKFTTFRDTLSNCSDKDVMKL